MRPAGIWLFARGAQLPVAGIVSGLTVTPAGSPCTSTVTGPAKPLERVTCTYHAVRDPGPIIAFDGSHLSVKSGRAQSASRKYT